MIPSPIHIWECEMKKKIHFIPPLPPPLGQYSTLTISCLHKEFCAKRITMVIRIMMVFVQTLMDDILLRL